MRGPWCGHVRWPWHYVPLVCWKYNSIQSLDWPMSDLLHRLRLILFVYISFYLLNESVTKRVSKSNIIRFQPLERQIISFTFRMMRQNILSAKSSSFSSLEKIYKNYYLLRQWNYAVHVESRFLEEIIISWNLFRVVTNTPGGHFHIGLYMPFSGCNF